MALEGFRYKIDIVMCIDSTGSMAHLIEQVKENALSFYEDLMRLMSHRQRPIDQLRVKVISFRDYYEDGDKAMLISDFFSLPEKSDDFSGFVRSVHADGGGDPPETSLEALVLAIKADWVRGPKCRQIIVLWTDTTPHPLDRNLTSKPANYPADMPQNFDALTDLWSDTTYLDEKPKRLILYAPDVNPWSVISEHWNNVIHYPSQAGKGLEEFDYSQILDAVANSI
jgi:hypothetical protein